MSGRNQPNSNLYSSEKALFHRDRLQLIQESRQPYPVHVEVVLSDLCNQDCSFCAYRLDGYSSSELFRDPAAPIAHNPNRMLPTAKVMQLLEDCQDMGVKAIQLTGGGEPTLHPDFERVAMGVLEGGMKLAVVSNGTRLHRTSQWLRTTHRLSRISLLARASWVRISLDAATPQTYGRIRRVNPNTFHRVLGNIRSLVDEVAARGTATRVGIGFVVTRENYLELPRAIDLAEDLGVDNIRISAAFTPQGHKYHESHVCEVRDMLVRARAMPRREGYTIYDNFGIRLEDLDGEHPDYRTCPIMHLQTYVGGDGNVYTCCINAYNSRGKIGSFLDHGFKALWHSHAKRTFFEGFDAKQCPACMHNAKNRFMNDLIAREPIPKPKGSAPEHVEFV